MKGNSHTSTIEPWHIVNEVITVLTTTALFPGPIPEAFRTSGEPAHPLGERIVVYQMRAASGILRGERAFGNGQDRCWLAPSGWRLTYDLP